LRVGDLSPNLLYADITMIANYECKKSYGDTVTDKVICGVGAHSSAKNGCTVSSTLSLSFKLSSLLCPRKCDLPQILCLISRKCFLDIVTKQFFLVERIVFSQHVFFLLTARKKTT